MSRQPSRQLSNNLTEFPYKLWAQRLKRVFNIDIEVCDICGNKVKVIACIEEPAVIKQILKHLKEKAPATIKYAIPEGGSPSQRSLFTD